jgi:hypothetical protein
MAPPVVLSKAVRPRVSSAQLKKRTRVSPPTFQALSRGGLAEIASEILKQPIKVPAKPVFEISTRHPYDAAGLMDVYHPGRWDTSSDLIFMHPIVQTGPSVGEWDGTVIYANYRTPVSGKFLVVGNFTGHQITMNLHGPWGKSSAFSATSSTAAAVTAFWTASAGDSLWLTMSCTGQILGYVQSIQVFAM